MIIHNPILTGSFTVNGTDVSSITSSAASLTSLNAYTASQNNRNGTYATTGSNTFAGIQTVNSNLIVTGSITAQTLVVQTVSSSVIYSSGSNVFGNNIANTQTFTGSLQTTGSNTFSGYSVFSSNINEVARFKSSYANGVYLTFESGSTLIGDIGNSSEVFTGASTLDFGINARGNRKLQLGVNQTPVMTISGNNVGIGTIAPNVILEVQQSNITNMGISFMNTYGVSGASGSTVDISSQLVGPGLSGQIGSMIRTGKEGDYSSGGARDAYFSLQVAQNDSLVERIRIDSSGITRFKFVSDRGIRMGGTLSTESNLASYQAFTENIRELRIVGSTLYFNTGDGSNSTGTERMSITEAGVVQFGSSSSRRNALQQSYFGYSNSYKTLLIGSTGTDYSTDAVTLCFGVDVSGNANGSFSGNGTEYIWRNAGSFKSPNSANNNYNTLLSWNSSGVVTVTTSDYRAKEDLKSFEALPMIEAMKLYDFRWIELQERMHGVLAHELQDIVPYAVIGEKDGGSMQGVDYSKLVPVMLKAIQELQAQITELKNK
jgi:hypothetical protein